ncbi:hypothetical protein L596_008570 [Steinernema carpocapsae]|uniref:G-protein coupled receptors family 1 profile domain-containing protein n=1 Tax=Steinernema carpocapsae TaxID=34508 RepID=A0A4U5PCW1_STECR|nr:hypothetical protein L596_008570 [Steinernema carpocapsae]
MAVTRPLRYKTVVTKAKVISVIVIIWVFSCSILLTTVRWDQPNCVDKNICFAGNEIRHLAHSVVFAFFLPASVTLTLYWRIYRLARNRQKALDRGFLMILNQNMNFLTNTLSQHNNALRVHFGKSTGMVEHQRRILRTHERIAKTLGVVSCSFLICWLPFFLLYLTNFQCQGCIWSLLIDISSWLGYCNSMINPIIYSFTVKEFKRSALRMVLPAWRVFYRFFPICVAAPPEHVTSRMSRTAHKGKGGRPRSFENHKKQNLVSKLSHRRRLTEPAVFTLNAMNKFEQKQQIIEEEVEVEEDDTATRHFTTDCDLQPVPTSHSDTPCQLNPNRKSSGYSSRHSLQGEERKSSFLSVQNGYRKPSSNGIRKVSESKLPLLSNGTPAAIQCNGKSTKDGEPTNCSVTVYCDTNEMNV